MQCSRYFTASALIATVSAVVSVERSCSQDYYPDHRAFTLAQTSSTAMTLELCRDFCFSKGANAFGLEFSKECYCAAPGEYAALVPATNPCSKPCSGNPSTTCGGDNALQVYEFVSAPPATYLGCARDYYPDSRVLSGPFYQDDGDNSNAKCQDYCFENGFTLAGTEYGDECFCGTAADRDNLVWADNCDEACTSGNGICGGDNALSLYSLDQKVQPLVSSSVPPYSRRTSSVVPRSSAAPVVSSSGASESPAVVSASASASAPSSSVAATTSSTILSSSAAVPTTSTIPSTSSTAVILTTSLAPSSTVKTTTLSPSTTQQASTTVVVISTTTSKTSTLTTSTKAATTSAAPGTTKLCFLSFELDEIFDVLSIGGAVLSFLSDALSGSRALVLSKLNILSSLPISHETTIPGCPISKQLSVEFYYKSSTLYFGKSCSLVATAGASSTTIAINGGNPWTKASFQSISASSDLKVKFELKCAGFVGFPLLAPVNVDSVTIKY